jgi:Na+/proline symporter
MLTILQQLFPDQVGGRPWLILAGLLLSVGVYSILAGLWGVAVTDCIQFLLAMGGCIALAVVAVKQVGGIAPLRSAVEQHWGEEAFRFLPTFSGNQAGLSWDVFLIMLLVQWWASWYPGAEPGGGGYIVQRMASCRDERHAMLATLWFQVAHYCLRPWPWLLVAFAAMALFPAELSQAAKPEIGFPMIIRELAPPGMRGLLLVAFFAAYMSTISTQLNWGASYLVADVYQRFVRPEASQQALVRASRVASLLMLVLGGVGAYSMQHMRIDQTWKFLMALGAGSGAVYILRWFWWRINAWSEISAMAASLFYFVLFSLTGRFASLRQEYQLAIVAVPTILTWLAVTWLTPPESPAVLQRFYRQVRPGGPGWRPVAQRCPELQPVAKLGPSIGAALVAALLVYLTLPATGAWILGDFSTAVGCSLGALICTAVLGKWIPRLLPAEETTSEI